MISCLLRGMKTEVQGAGNSVLGDAAFAYLLLVSGIHTLSNAMALHLHHCSGGWVSWQGLPTLREPDDAYVKKHVIMCQDIPAESQRPYPQQLTQTRQYLHLLQYIATTIFQRTTIKFKLIWDVEPLIYNCNCNSIYSVKLY